MQLPTRSDCSRCDLHTTARSVGTPTVLLPWSAPPPSPSIVYVGQNPGHKEDAAGLPFIGPSGKMLKWSYIVAARHACNAPPAPDNKEHTALRHFSVWLTNAARCLHDGGPKPTNAQYKACSPHLLTDLLHIAALDPTHSPTIICTGADALHWTMTALYSTLSSKPPFTKLRDGFANQRHVVSLPPSSHKHPTSNPFTFTLFFTYHPAAILRDNARIRTVGDHLSLVNHHLTSTYPSAIKPNLVPPAPPPRSIP